MRSARPPLVRWARWVAVAVVVLTSSGAVASPLGFFTWAPRVSDEVARVLALYESGDLLAAAAASSRALVGRDAEPFHEELLLVRGLALADSGWTEEAEASLIELLDLAAPSPYYPLALLELIELRHAAGRLEAVASAYERYWQAPWRGRSPRDARTRRFLDAYGDLREAGPRLTEEEQDLLARPVRLAELAPLRKERPSERLLYLCGLDLLRLGRYDQSLDALDRIRLVSLYQPWALYAAAQDLYASGKSEDALERLRRLRRLPANGDGERELRDRAVLLGMQMLFDDGRGAEAMEAAVDVDGGGRSAVATRLLRAEVALALGQPSLALALARDLGEQPLDARLDAERALATADASTRLGDDASAAATLRAASARAAEAREALEPPNDRVEIDRLRAAVATDAASLRDQAVERRRHLTAGIRRVLALRGPMNVGKLVRIVMTSHRSSIVGQPVYDLSGIAESDPRPPVVSPGGGTARPAYLQSPLRRSIEAAEAAKLALGPEPPATALATADALLGLLDGRFGMDDAACAPDRSQAGAELVMALVGGAAAAPLAACPVLAPQARSLRAALLVAEKPVAVEAAVLAAARRHALDGLDRAIGNSLRLIVADEARALRRIEFELDSALSDAMLRQNAAARSRSAARP